MTQIDLLQETPLDLSARTENDISYFKKAHYEIHTESHIDAQKKTTIKMENPSNENISFSNDVSIDQGAFKLWGQDDFIKQTELSQHNLDTSIPASNSKLTQTELDNPDVENKYVMYNVSSQHSKIFPAYSGSFDFNHSRYLSADWLSRPSPWVGTAGNPNIARPKPIRQRSHHSQLVSRHEVFQIGSKSFGKPVTKSSTSNRDNSERFQILSRESGYFEKPLAISTRSAIDIETHHVSKKTSNAYLDVKSGEKNENKLCEMPCKKIKVDKQSQQHNTYIRDFRNMSSYNNVFISNDQQLSLMRNVKSRILLKNALKNSKPEWSLKLINKNRKVLSRFRNNSIKHSDLSDATISCRQYVSSSDNYQSQSLKINQVTEIEPNKQRSGSDVIFKKDVVMEEKKLQPLDLSKPKKNDKYITTLDLNANNLTSNDTVACQSSSRRKLGKTKEIRLKDRTVNNNFKYPKEPPLETSISTEINSEMSFKQENSECEVFLGKLAKEEKRSNHIAEKQILQDYKPPDDSKQFQQLNSESIKVKLEVRSPSPRSSSDDMDFDLPVKFQETHSNHLESPLQNSDSNTRAKSSSRDSYKCDDCKAHCLSFSALLQHQRMGCLNKQAIDSRTHAYNCPVMFKSKDSEKNCECMPCPKCGRIFKSGFAVFSHYQRGCYGFAKSCIKYDRGDGSVGSSRVSTNQFTPPSTVLNVHSFQEAKPSQGANDNSGTEVKNEPLGHRHTVKRENPHCSSASTSSGRHPSDKSRKVMSIKKEGRNVTLPLQTAVAYGSSVTSAERGNTEKVIYLLDAANKPIMLVKKPGQTADDSPSSLSCRFKTGNPSTVTASVSPAKPKT